MQVLSKLSIDIFNELTQFLHSHKDELCLTDYSMLKMKMICQLHMIALEIDNEIDKIYNALLYNLNHQHACEWEEARQSFENFEHEKSIDVWKSLTDHARVTEKKRLAYDNNIIIIWKYWFRNSNRLFNLNMNSLFVFFFLKFAWKYHYFKAMRWFCCAAHWCLTNIKTTEFLLQMIIYADFCSVLNNSDLKQKSFLNEELSQIECQISQLNFLELCLSDEKEKWE